MLSLLKLYIGYKRIHNPPYFIYINGYPGIGKLTIANELAKLLPNTKVYHKHHMIDPVAALVNQDDKDYKRIHSTIRRYILHVITISDSTRNCNWIFTDTRCSDCVDSKAAEDYKLAAERGEMAFIPVIMSCSLEENLQRASTSSSSIASSTTKLIDLATVQKVRQEAVMYQFGGREELQLDVTDLTAPGAARKIYQHLISLNE